MNNARYRETERLCFPGSHNRNSPPDKARALGGLSWALWAGAGLQPPGDRSPAQAPLPLTGPSRKGPSPARALLPRVQAGVSRGQSSPSIFHASGRSICHLSSENPAASGLGEKLSWNLRRWVESIESEAFPPAGAWPAGPEPTSALLCRKPQLWGMRRWNLFASIGCGVIL